MSIGEPYQGRGGSYQKMESHRLSHRNLQLMDKAARGNPAGRESEEYKL